MNNIKDLTDFYMWMVANDYDHNIRIRVEKKAEMYLKTLKQGQELPIHDVSDWLDDEQIDCGCEHETCKRLQGKCKNLAYR